MTVEIRSRAALPLVSTGYGEAFEFSSGQAIHTDAAGRFATPPVPRSGLYQATVTAPGRDLARSEWLFLSEQGAAAEFGEIVIPRRITARGRVLDHAGQPLAGAKVTLLGASGRQTVTSDSQGHFELASIPDGPAFFTIQHADCRFYGERLKHVPAMLERRLTRLGEPSGLRMSTRAAMARADRLRLAHRLFDPYQKQVQSKPIPLNRLGMAARVEAVVDPRELLRQLREKASVVPALAAEGFRMRVITSLGAEHLDEARELVEESSEPAAKAESLCLLSKMATNPVRKREFVAEALVDARASHKPAMRIAAMAHVGSLLLDLGEKEKGAAVLKEALGEVEGLPKFGEGFFARAELAVNLARIDVPAAVELLKGSKGRPQQFAHRCGELARVVATIDPAAAENILKMIPEWSGPEKFSWQHLFVPRVACGMAARDLPRARRLADALDSAAARGWAYGAMAHTLAATDRSQATELLRHAFALLDQAGNEEPDPVIDRATAAGALVTTAEKIDPALVPECFWHAVSFAKAAADDEKQPPQRSETNGQLASLLARYEPGIATIVYQMGDLGEIFSARRLLFIDPERAVRLVESLPALDEEGWPRDETLLLVVEELALPDADFWDHMMRESVGWGWFPD